MTTKRVLIVEDTKEIARLLKAALTTLHAGIEVVVVPSAEEAILEIARGKFELLVVDVRLPGLSGLELTRKLRARNKNMRVVQISGMNDPELKDQALKVGADMFFPKPLVMSEFLAAIARLLGLTGPLEQEGAPSAALPDLLAGLRGALAAVAAALLDERGRLVAQAGELPDGPIRETGIPGLMSAVSAAEKAARPLGSEGSENLTLVRGKEWDFLAAAVGSEHTLLVVLRRAKGSVRLAIAVDELLSAQKEAVRLLAEMQSKPASDAVAAPVPQPVPDTAEPAPLVVSAAAAAQPALPLPPIEEPVELTSEEESSAAGLEELFAETPAVLKNQDVDDFWEKVTNKKDTGELTNPPDMLTYDQASRLGLTPEDEGR